MNVAPYFVISGYCRFINCIQLIYIIINFFCKGQTRSAMRKIHALNVKISSGSGTREKGGRGVMTGNIFTKCKV